MYFQTSSNQIGVKNVSNIVRILNIPKVYALNLRKGVKKKNNSNNGVLIIVGSCAIRVMIPFSSSRINWFINDSLKKEDSNLPPVRSII